jgi:predicted HTH transcriptional regulator
MGSEPKIAAALGEDYLLERKTKNDLKDLLKTMVAFANTVRPGHIATILIGERDDGTAEGSVDTDAIQKTVRKEAEKIYPGIVWRTSVYLNEGAHCVRVEIEYSGDTPHFGGPAWVRKGSESVLATDQELQRLIDTRSSIVREIDQWVEKVITLELITKYSNGQIALNCLDATVKRVNQFFATLEYNRRSSSYPLKAFTLSWDDDQNRMKLTYERFAVGS